MLKIFRRRKLVIRLFVGTILVMVSVAMVITLIPGIMGTTADPFTGAVVAEVAGEQITAWELQQSLFRMSQAGGIPPDLMPIYATQILDRMVLEKATVREAERLGLRVEESELRTRLRQNPQLFPEGSFVGQEQYENLVYSQYRLTVPQFETRFRDSLLQQKLRYVVTDAVTVTPEEVREAFFRENEKMVLNYVFFDPGTFLEDIPVTDADLEGYYRNNQSRYQIPEKRSAKVLLVEREKVREATNVPEAEIRRYYEEHKDSFRQEERVRVSHILLRAPEEEEERVAEAKQRAQDLVQQLREGADFATLAQEHSDDQASASQGGDLGWIVRGQTVPEFEQTAFSLAPGSISDPVETLYGIHILQVEAHEKARLRPLEEVRPEIETALLDQKVEEKLSELAGLAAVDLRREPDQIEALAERYQGTVLTPPPVSENESIDRIGASVGFMQEVFVLQEGEVGQSIPVADGYAIPLLVEILPVHQGELSEVREQVREDYLDERSREMAREKAQELAKLIEEQEEQDFQQAARALDLPVETTDPITRSGNIPSVGSVESLAPEVFRIPAGEVAGPVSVGGGQVVYQLESREPPKEEDLEAQREQIRQRLLNEKRSLVFGVFQDDLKQRMMASGDLKIYSDVLNQFMAGASPTP